MGSIVFSQNGKKVNIVLNAQALIERNLQLGLCKNITQNILKLV